MLRAAICGAGHWGTRLIESVQGRSNKIGFVAAVTRDPIGKQALAERFGLKLTANFADVLADRAIDAVVLATPHSQHAGEIVAAAKAGKHVFCEKPFTLTRGDAQAAIAACQAAGVTLHVGFNRRYAPAYVDMTRRITAGEIGVLRHIEGQFSGPSSYQTAPDNWRSNRIESPGGAMTARG
ncbi:MAG: Gfo/Idh/MocA family oxidoreductase, partial [Rhizobiales bacterium]|nr:Gfo/Idh/MocA family oxidoreductase [Hyphomicrobiales bacterium]